VRSPAKRPVRVSSRRADIQRADSDREDHPLTAIETSGIVGSS